jgi:hypothetical protein
MSISLLALQRGKPTESGRILPIASESVFDLYWAPAAEALSLEWIPLFRTGLPVQPEDVGDILDELRILRERIGSLGGDAAEVMLPRIDQLIAELRAIGADPNLELYIG